MLYLPFTPIGKDRIPTIPERIKIIDNLIDNVKDLFTERWEDLRFPATQLKVNPVIDKPDFDYTNVGYLFDPATTETIFLIVQLPHGWKQGSNLRPHIHWQPTTTNNGNVLWRLEYKWTNYNEVEAGSWTTVDVIATSIGVVGTHQVISFAELNGTNKLISSILTIKLSRIGGDVSDTCTADALLKEFDIHYLVDSNGSVNEFIK